MLVLTPHEVQELLDIIEKHHIMFIGTNVGMDVLTPDERKTLEGMGVNVQSWVDTRSTVDEAFSFGMLASAVGDERAKDMNYRDFKKFIQSKNYFPLERRERAAIDHLKYRAYSDIKNLTQKVRNDLIQIVLNGDKEYRAKYEEIIKKEAIRVVEKRGTVRDMISEIGHKTNNWKRDLGRIAEYVLHEAYEEGRASELERQGGTDVLVYKDVYPGACTYCIRHYLMNGLGSQPRVFKLSELKANGSNVNRKQADWLPVLGPMHPYCRCTINQLPEGYVWDTKQKKFVRGERELKEKVRNRQKVFVKIGDKEYFV